MSSSAVFALLDLFFPPRCMACDVVIAGTTCWCDDCALQLTETGPQHCSRCAEPGAYPTGLCARCTTAAPPFVKAYAPFEHEGAVAKAVHRFKYEGHAELAKPLASVVASTSGRLLDGLPGTICPIPLHDGRFRARGYDQATLLAVELARVLQRPFDDSWLRRVKATTQQVGLPEAAREANVQGAFLAKASVKGQRVVLVDDVLTTGATAREATKALLAAGAACVSVLTVARARRESATSAPAR